MANSISETSDPLLGQPAEALTEADFPVRAKKTLATKARREVTLRTDREIVAAKLARSIGRGHDAIYHGTRAPEKVLRSGKLIPSFNGVSFSRSPEEAAHFAYLIGGEVDQWSPALLVLDRSSLKQVYRLEPYRDDEEYDYDEREETVWGRTISFRRHLLGVVRETDVNNILGPRKLKFISPPGILLKSRAFYQESRELGERFVRDGRTRVRDIIVREREKISDTRSPVVQAAASAPRASRLPKSQRQCARRRS